VAAIRLRRFCSLLVIYLGGLDINEARGERLKPGLQRWSPGFSRYGLENGI